MAMLRCVSLVERAFVPSFVFFFAMLYPFRWVNRPDRRTAAAAGGCILVDRELLEQSGGLAAVRGELIDDCALARRVKGYRPIRLDLTRRVVSVRAYPTLGSIRRMIARSAYAQLRFSPLLLAATVVAMVVTYVAPPLLAVAAAGLPRILGVLAWAAMALALQPMLRFYRVSPLWGLALPAIAAMYVLFTIDSAWQSARGRAGAWKGRVYPAPMDRG
jgi:hopene-associated glycosyltransferase HpnB